MLAGPNTGRARLPLGTPGRPVLGIDAQASLDFLRRHFAPESEYRPAEHHVVLVDHRVFDNDAGWRSRRCGEVQDVEAVPDGPGVDLVGGGEDRPDVRVAKPRAGAEVRPDAVAIAAQTGPRRDPQSPARVDRQILDLVADQAVRGRQVAGSSVLDVAEPVELIAEEDRAALIYRERVGPLPLETLLGGPIGPVAVFPAAQP